MKKARHKKIALGLGSLIIAVAIIALLVWFANLPKGCTEIKENCPNDTIIIYSPNCPHCQKALPILQEIEKEMQKNFTYYNIANESDAQTIISRNLLSVAHQVPTLITNCKVCVGSRTKEEYLKILS